MRKIKLFSLSLIMAACMCLTPIKVNAAPEATTQSTEETNTEASSTENASTESTTEANTENNTEEKTDDKEKKETETTEKEAAATTTDAEKTIEENPDDAVDVSGSANHEKEEEVTDAHPIYDLTFVGTVVNQDEYNVACAKANQSPRVDGEIKIVITPNMENAVPIELTLNNINAFKSMVNVFGDVDYTVEVVEKNDLIEAVEILDSFNINGDKELTFSIKYVEPKPAEKKNPLLEASKK